MSINEKLIIKLDFNVDLCHNNTGNKFTYI